MTYRPPVPITLLTGFLGAGKTTWLSRALQDETADRVAVLVNEFGAVGIDHLLVGTIAPDTVLLNSGCVCCQIRGELKDAILTLIAQARSGEIPQFDRIVIETTGLADPSQILSTLTFDPVLHNQVVLQDVVTVADALNGASLHAKQPEWVAQVAAASTILLSKTDLVPETRLQDLGLRLALINPAAQLLDARENPTFADIVGGGTIDPGASWAAGSAHRDGTGAATLGLTFQTSLDWTRFVVWLSALIHRHGANLLRVKCLLKTDTGFVLIDGVGHTLHHPRHLDSAIASDQSSHLVFIARDLDMARLRASFEAFLNVKTV
ncbi:GTP-binding protein [Marinovum sp. 2_MG-2023]|uniref:CobW family GTP-binding protein n=1 Tax=unclassified Marinovum TaxID=2647166 RepID=UPI0026E40CEC|nr:MULTISPECIES: GTP-binding protein [unclassified Marinovum]MDO6729608.1 GTP-binding protein [Marinovum sp. 2_MG-2023]MDO6780238.1 GTP-binding protein [Marinovum sp. 1_MG-2023]